MSTINATFPAGGQARNLTPRACKSTWHANCTLGHANRHSGQHNAKCIFSNRIQRVFKKRAWARVCIEDPCHPQKCICGEVGDTCSPVQTPFTLLRPRHTLSQLGHFCGVSFPPKKTRSSDSGGQRTPTERSPETEHCYVSVYRVPLKMSRTGTQEAHCSA